LSRDPRQRQLSGSAALLAGDTLDVVDDAEDLGEVLRVVARDDAADVARREVVDAAVLASEHAAAERRVADDGGAQFARGSEHADLRLLDVCEERRVLDLVRGDRRHRARAPQSVRAALRQPKVLDLALRPQLEHRVDRLLDGDFGVDTVVWSARNQHRSGRRNWRAPVGIVEIDVIRL